MSPWGLGARIRKPKRPRVVKRYNYAIGRNEENQSALINALFDVSRTNVFRLGHLIAAINKISSNDQSQWQKDNAMRLKELSQKRHHAFAESQQKQNEEASRRYRSVCKQNRKAARQMFAKWWDDRLHDMEVAAEHGDSRSLHQGVKQLIDLFANDGTSKKAQSSNHQEDHENMTKILLTVTSMELETFYGCRRAHSNKLSTARIGV